MTNYTDIAAEQYQAAGKERGDLMQAVATYEAAYFEAYRFRAPRVESFTIPVKLSKYDKAPKLCTFTLLRSSQYADTYSSKTTYLVRYRTGKKLHEKRPVISLAPQEFIPESLDLTFVRTNVRYGNHRSVEFPVSWKDQLPAYAEKRLAK